MSLNQKTYRAILVYFSFLLGWLLIFCGGAALIGPEWEHGSFIKSATLLAIAIAGVSGFLLALVKLKDGTPWGYCVWFFSCWMIGIYTFIEKSSLKSLLRLSDALSGLFEMLLVWSIFGVLPYACVKLFGWLRSFISTGSSPFESQNVAINSAASRVCNVCHSKNQLSAGFCGNCGASLPKEERCQHCNTLRQLGQKFCHSCGKPSSST